MLDPIIKHGIHDFRSPISEWRVYLPTDMDRDKYIKTCYLTGTISITNENAEVKHRVKIGQLALQLVRFPKESGELGSEVVCVASPYGRKLYIVDVYTSSSEFNDQEEDQFRLFKSNDNQGFSEIKIDGSGKIFLSVDGTDENAEINVMLSSTNKKAKFNLNVNGDIVVQNEGTTTLTSNQNVAVKVNDGKEGGVESFVNIKKDEINLVSQTGTSIDIKKDEIKIISTGKIYLNDSEEPILLGKKTVQLLDDLLQQLGKESAGPYPLLGNPFYLQLAQQLEQLKSTISFVK